MIVQEEIHSRPQVNGLGHLNITIKPVHSAFKLFYGHHTGRVLGIDNKYLEYYGGQHSRNQQGNCQCYLKLY